MSNYEDPVRATVHRLLEEYVEKAFREFMEGRTGMVIQGTTDGKAVKDYRTECLIVIGKPFAAQISSSG